MSQSNNVITTNDNLSSLISTNKPLAFVQPRIRDRNSTSHATDRLNKNQIEKQMSFTSDESFSYVRQSRKLPMKKIPIFNHDKK